MSTRKSDGQRKAAPTEPERGAGKPGPDSILRWLPLLALAALTAIFFWPYLTPLKSGQAWLWEDFLHFSYPVRFFAATSLVRGEFPFWNPYVFGGMPFFADIQTAVLYPLNLVQTVFAGADSLSPRVVQLFDVLHYFLAGWLCWRFLRYLKLSADSSLLGAVTFAFSGFLITHAIHLNFINVFIWLPLILELFQRALDSGRLRWAVGAALTLALSTMGGYPQYTLYICYVLGLQWLLHEVGAREHGGTVSLSASGARFLTLLGVVGFGVGLNAFNWLPAAELARYTPRSSMTWEASVEHSLHPLLLFKLICPGFFGTQYPAENTYWAGGYSAFWETCLFVGVLPLSLALWALGAFRRDRRVQFAALLTGLSLWLALGRFGGLYWLCFKFAPGFGRFRIPGRFAALASFGLALLAALGWEALRRKRSEAGGKVVRGPLLVAAALGVVVVLMLCLLYAGALNGLFEGALTRPEVKSLASTALLHSVATIACTLILLGLAAGGPLKFDLRWMGYAAVLFTFFELLTFGRPFLDGKTDPGQFYADSPAAVQLKKELQTELFRINARSLENPGVMVLRRNQGCLDRLFLLEGYNPLQLKRRLGEVGLDRQFDLLNVKYRIVIDYQQQRAGLVPNPTCMPRAFLLSRWRVLQEDPVILATLNDSTFDYRGEAVLEKAPGIDSSKDQGHIETKAEVKRYSQNEITVETDSPAPGILVLSEWDYPAWKAWVDGSPQEILRADYALRAVALPAGRHSVRFAYESDSVRRGVLLSLGAALALAAFSLLSARWWRRW
ncbi:YfhO family protein [bacterium]|nr:YfhO family protein [bacterium]